MSSFAGTCGHKPFHESEAPAPSLLLTLKGGRKPGLYGGHTAGAACLSLQEQGRHLVPMSTPRGPHPHQTPAGPGPGPGRGGRATWVEEGLV